MDNHPKCAACGHYNEQQPGVGGLCMRHPPTLIMVPGRMHGSPGGIGGQNPPVQAGHWCGDHVYKVATLALQ